jgi:hypothetical protein
MKAFSTPRYSRPLFQRGWLGILGVILGLQIGLLPAFAAKRLLGDVNGDDAVDLADVMRLISLVVGKAKPSPAELLAGDVAPFPGTEGRKIGDGKLTTADAIRLLRRVVGIIPFAQFGPATVEVPGEEAQGNPSLEVDTESLADRLKDPKRAKEIEVPVVLRDVKNVIGLQMNIKIEAIGGTKTVLPKIVKITRGEFVPEKASFDTVPDPLPAGGTTEVVVAFILFSETGGATGSGEVCRLTLSVPPDIPKGAKYRLKVEYPEVVNNNADTILVAVSDGILSFDPR